MTKLTNHIGGEEYYRASGTEPRTTRGFVVTEGSARREPPVAGFPCTAVNWRRTTPPLPFTVDRSDESDDKIVSELETLGLTPGELQKFLTIMLIYHVHHSRKRAK